MVDSGTRGRQTVANAQDIAQSVAREVAEDPDRVGPFVTVEDLGEGVSDFRFACLMKGYEGWQWSVTLYHDSDRDVWTVDESTLVPAEGALLPPAWVPWKDRLVPSDLSVTDVLGTPADDARLEGGVASPTEGATSPTNADDDVRDAGDGGSGEATGTEPADGTVSASADDDAHEVVAAFSLARHRVLSPVGRSQAADRWYQGQHGPRSLSARAAGKENPCSTCGFLVPIAGDLGTMFGVCANLWSPDDGRVVSLDHGCGQHSDIEPPAAAPLWVQSAPAYDDTRIDVIRRIPREESSAVELIEDMENDGDDARTSQAPDDGQEGMPADEERRTGIDGSAEDSIGRSVEEDGTDVASTQDDD